MLLEVCKRAACGWLFWSRFVSVVAGEITPLFKIAISVAEGELNYGRTWENDEDIKDNEKMEELREIIEDLKTIKDDGSGVLIPHQPGSSL
jgi:hypothetical protein